MVDVKPRWISLSYPLGVHTPTYGQNPPVKVTQIADIEKGDIANWLEFTTINHNGTHIDAPYHFNAQGMRIHELDPNDLCFTTPLLLDLPKTAGELVSAEDLTRFHDALKRTDLLLVRTGWAERYRASDPVRYGTRAPGFDRSSGEFLIGETSVEAIAMDFPSAASPVVGWPNDEGIEFHRIMLGSGKPREARYILLIEDVNVGAITNMQSINRIIVAPAPSSYLR